MSLMVTVPWRGNDYYMNRRYAYLIMVHKSLDQVTKLCRLLDDCRNDLYIHLDSKVVNRGIWENELQNSVSESTITFVPPVSVSWGGASQIKAELSLLKSAVQRQNYAYYHLISGADLPLKSQDDIHSFFDSRIGMEFVQLGTKEYQKSDVPDRVRYWFVWQEFIGNAPNLSRKILGKVQSLFVLMQRIGHIDFNRHNQIREFYGGSQWFSITDAFARYVIAHESWITYTFQRGKCVDEVFLQTLLLNSPFASRRYMGIHFDDDFRPIMRNIDWKRGRPYVWRNGDFDELMSSGFLFARKFDESVDSEIIDRIFNAVSKH